LAAAQKFQIDTDTVHLDSSSFHLHGEYEIQDVQVTLAPGKINSVESDMAAINHLETPVPITITYGYSRDHRPDLKQFILDIICSGDGDIPLFLRVGSGNEADSAVFGRILKEFKQQLNLDNLMVADSALYTATNL
ncbi:MAG TPA: IS1634 family transposase, partial [Cyanobacteria bacterium UBA11369]|nr:IS1634 family transposase [Cyanobacteria bacterium UBA11369]